MNKEEIEEYINKIEPNFDSHLEKGTIEMSNEYYNLLEEKMARLINKNQELKKQLETINKKYNFESKYREKNYKMLREKDAQQQEFIEYITSYIELLNNKPDLIEESQKDVLEEILSKYKEIIEEPKDKWNKLKIWLKEDAFKNLESKGIVLTTDEVLNQMAGLDDEEEPDLFEMIEDMKNRPKHIEELETNEENTLFTMQCYTGIPEVAEDWNFNIIKNKIDELTKAVNYLLDEDGK